MEYMSCMLHLVVGGHLKDRIWETPTCLRENIFSTVMNLFTHLQAILSYKKEGGESVHS